MGVQIQSRYETRRVLGMGPNGVVYEAHDNETNRTVALKMIRGAPGAEALDRFRLVCETLAALAHPKIAETLEFGEFEEQGLIRAYLVTPCLAGDTLDDLIRASSPRLTVDQSVDVVVQACHALQAAHDRGLVHGDLKPTNIFLMQDDSVKIIDFGMGCLADPQSIIDHKESLLYLAPEQVEMQPASALSDIYSLGMVCFHMLTSRHPFDRENSAEIPAAILKGLAPPASVMNPFVSEAMSQAIDRALSKRPSHRFASAREFAEALRRSAGEKPAELPGTAALQFDAGTPPVVVATPKEELAVAAPVPGPDAKARWLEQINQQFQAGDLAGAHELWKRAAAEFPGDADLTELYQQMMQTLARQTQARKLLAQGQALSAQQRFEEAIEAFQQARQMDPQNTAILEALVATLTARASTPLAAKPPEPLATVQFPLPAVPTAPPPRDLPPPPATPAPVMAPATGPFEPTGPPGPPPLKPKFPWVAVGATGIAVVGLVGTAMLLPKLIHPRPAKAPPPVVQVTPPPPPPPPPVVQPVNTSVRVFADLVGGKFSLDDQPPSDVEDGQVSLDSVPAGKHTMKIVSPSGQVAIDFETAPGAAPVIDSITAKEVLAVAVTSMGGHAKVQSSSGPAKVSVDGKPAGETGPSGLDLNDLTPGDHQVALGEGKNAQSLVVGISAVPMLAAYLKSDRNVGTLVVATTEDGVRLFLDGKEYRRPTQRGQLRIPNLSVREHTVRVVKDGFQEVPEQKVAIRKGEEAKLTFQLQAVPKMASLSIRGAPPGALVMLDQERIGTVQPDGGFTSSSITPGEHTVELRKESYRAKRIQKRFEAGAAVQIAGGDVVLEKLLATLRWNVAPANAQVSIGRSGETPRPVTGSSITLADGTYMVTAHAPNYVDHSVTVTLAPGETKAVDLTLTAVKPVAPVIRVLGMADWDDPAVWTRENEWYVKKGGDYIGYKPAQTAGSFTFTVQLRKGKRVQWVVARTDARNYLLFQIDKKNFYRSRLNQGRESDSKKISHLEEKDNTYTIQIDVGTTGIVHKLYDGEKWITMDTWVAAGQNFTEGKFGFLLPGSDTIAISNFSFTPR